MTAQVHGSDNFEVGDILTCKLRVDFVNLEKGQQSGYVHSKHYPYLRRDCWYLVITDETMTGLAAVEKINIDQEFYEKEFQEKISRVGPVKFIALLVNDSYKGLDQVVKVDVQVTEKTVDRIEYQYLEEDMEVVKPPKPEDDEETAEDSDQDKPEVEIDTDELKRRLKRAGLTKALDAFKKQMDREDKLITEGRISEIIKQNPFIPEAIKTIDQIKQEKAEVKKQEEAQVKVDKADK